MGQLAAILVVRTTDGENQFGDGALEGTLVLAEDGLKLVQADEPLAGARLLEVLVGIVGGGVVDEVLAEARREEVGEEGGLEDATLAHENQDVLVHHLERHPSHHHRHEPFLEEVAKPFLGVEVVGIILHHDAVGELLDVVGMFTSYPRFQTVEIFLEGIERLAEVAVDDVVERGARYPQPLLCHLSPEGVLQVVIDYRPVGIFAAQHHQAPDFVGSRHHVVMELISGGKPLLDAVDGRAMALLLAVTIEAP